MFFINPITSLTQLVTTFLFWGAVLLVIIVVVRAMTSSGPREDEVGERWGGLLPGQAKSAQEFMNLVEAELDARDSPFKGLLITGRGVATSGQSAFRVVHNHVFSCFIGYEQVGKDLYVTWALHEKTTWLYSIPLIGQILHRWWNIVTILDRNRLLAFGAFTKSCVENVVDSMMDKYSLDKTKLVRQSSGKLGPL